MGKSMKTYDIGLTNCLNLDFLRRVLLQSLHKQGTGIIKNGCNSPTVIRDKRVLVLVITDEEHLSGMYQVC